MTSDQATILAQQAKILELLLEMHDIRRRALESAAVEFDMVKGKVSGKAVANALRVMAREVGL